MSMFKKAVKESAKLRLAIAGPSGSGKTYSALAIATAFGGSVAVVDTEHGSASKYADLFDFDVAEMHAPYHPDKYVKAIHDAAEAGYNVIILDGMSHAWNGTGGLLELVEEAAKRMKNPNTYAAWKDVTPIQNRLIEAIVSAPIHLIATMRSKQDYVQSRDEKSGYTTIRKVGMAPVQREGFEYEFDVFFDMDIDNNAIVTKTRCSALTGKVIPQPGAQVAKTLMAWLSTDPTSPAPDKPAAPDVDLDQVEAIDPDATAVSQEQATASEPSDCQKLREWASNLHSDADAEPCTDKQYQYLAGLIDTLAGKDTHRAVLSYLCGKEITSRLVPARKVATGLLNALVEGEPKYNENVVACIKAIGAKTAAQPEMA